MIKASLTQNYSWEYDRLIAKAFAVSITLCLISGQFITSVNSAPALNKMQTKGTERQSEKNLGKNAETDIQKDAQNKDTTEKSAEKIPLKWSPEPIVENLQKVTTEQLVDKPQDYLNKTVKFNANFYAFSNLALDYKPAMRSSKEYLSFLVHRPTNHIPFSELKLAMKIPKEKDPENQLLAQLKDGDQLEVIGKVFATSLDEPWLDVIWLRKKEEKKVADSDSPAKLVKKKEKSAGPDMESVPNINQTRH